MNEKRVLEPEVLPPEPEPSAAGEESSPRSSTSSRAGLVVAGLLLDVMDLTTFGPVGVTFGLLVGATLAFGIGTLYRMPLKKRLLLALGAGIYCSLPMTELVPMGTLLGAYLGLKDIEESRR